MNTKIFCLWLGILSSLALASEDEPPLLWELTNGGLLLTEESTEKTIPDSGLSTRDSGNPDAAYITPNNTAFSSLALNRKLRLALPDEVLDVKITGLNKTRRQEIWSFSVLTDTATSGVLLPEGKLFVKGNSVAAWIPTRKSAWRVVDGVMRQEMKWGTAHIDYKVNSQVYGLQKYAPQVIQSAPDELSLPLRYEDNQHESHKTPQNMVSQAWSEDENYTAKLKVLFVYTPEFAQSEDAAQETIEQWLEVNNEIYEASGVNLQLEQSSLLEVALEDYSADEILDNLARSAHADSKYGSIPERILQQVWQERLDSEADVVTVFTHVRPGGVCGRSWVNGTPAKVFHYRFAINLVSANTRFASGNQQPCSLDTLGHEIGHNLGLAHSHAQGEQGSVFPYGRGYGVENEFSTVMAYPQAFGDAVAVPFYSSPELECGNEFACGVRSELSNGADAVKAINQIAARVARTHNEAVTLPIEDALAELDGELAECLLEAEDILLTNEEVVDINCPRRDVASLEGVEFFPRLSFLSVNSTENVSLEPLKNLQEVIALDFRFTRIEDLRPIAHLSKQLQYLQFFSENMSCQDEMVAASWGIEDFLAHRGCQSRNDDRQDFDNDGINNLNDVDDDNDGIDDLSDALPFDDSNAGDIDADGVPDEQDAFPYDPEEYQDSDYDTIGDNRDDDDDNDGVADDEDCAPLDPERAGDCEEDYGGNPGSDCGNNCSVGFVPYDFDGDGKADVAVRRASNATQYILNSSDSEIRRDELGRQLGDVVVSGDFDGDSLADLGIRRPGNHFWYIRLSSEGQNDLLRIEFGKDEKDIPVPADYDGDGITDVAVRRPATYQWFVLRSSDGEVGHYVFGRDEQDIPVPADYDGDGLADIAVRRPGNQMWYILNSTNNQISRINFGLREDDIPVPADYDGDGIADVAVRRPATQSWFILRSTDKEIMRVRFGLQQEDIPIIADYDGDGKADIAVRRPSVQMQYILRSSDLEIERIRFGLDKNDIPLAAPVMVRFTNNLGLKDVPEFKVQSNDSEEFSGIDILTPEQAKAMGVYRP